MGISFNYAYFAYNNVVDTKKLLLAFFRASQWWCFHYLTAGYSLRQAHTVAICSAMRSKVLCRVWACVGL